MKISKLSDKIILFLTFFVIFAKDAHAYLDPGTGSFVFQMVIAGALGGLFAVKTFWGNIKSFVSNIFSRDKKPSDPAKK